MTLQEFLPAIDPAGNRADWPPVTFSLSVIWTLSNGMKINLTAITENEVYSSIYDSPALFCKAWLIIKNLSCWISVLNGFPSPPYENYLYPSAGCVTIIDLLNKQSTSQTVGRGSSSWTRFTSTMVVQKTLLRIRPFELNSWPGHCPLKRRNEPRLAALSCHGRRWSG